MTDNDKTLTCGTCGHTVYHQFRDTREKLMQTHAKKHKEKK